MWTEPERIPLDMLGGTKDFVLPAIAVQPETRGAGAKLALAHYSLTTPDCAGAGCQLSAGFATTLDAGRRWEVDAVGDPMQLEWLTPTSIGRMVGDYVGAVFVPGRAVGIFSLAGARQGDRLDEAVYAASAPLPPLPRNTLRPRVVGEPRVARKLTCGRGSWSGTPPIAFAYRWISDGRVIPRTATATFRPTRRRAGALVACRVRATNGAGWAEATSKAVRVRR